MLWTTTLEARWLAGHAVTAIEVSSRGWPVASGTLSRRNYRHLSALSCRSSQLLKHCWVVHASTVSWGCVDPVSLFCIWRWPRLFILVALTEASTAGDGTDFHTQGDQAQPPVHHISCQWYSSPIISHEIWNPVHCCCHGSVSSKSLELGNSGSILGIQLSGIG